MARVLITGGSGHLGRLAAHEFCSAGHDVSLFDRVRPEDASRPWDTSLSVHVGELWDGSAVAAALERESPDIIVHLGANPLASDHPLQRPSGMFQHYDRVGRDDTMKSNVMGTYYLLDQAARTGVKRIVAASSYYVLGIGNRISQQPYRVEYLPIDEDHPTHPEDSYSLSKLLNEEMYGAFSRAYGLRTVALRLLGVYYHGETPPGWFRDHPLPPRHPEGLESVWMYVDGRDAAHAFLLASEAEGLDMFECFFIASGRTIKESPRHWLRQLYPGLRDVSQPLREWDDLITIGKATERLNYRPAYFWLDHYPEVMVGGSPI